MRRQIAIDLMGGILFAFISAGAYFISLGYDLGTVRRMGAGYFPAMVSILTFGLSILLIVITVVKMRRESVSLSDLWQQTEASSSTSNSGAELRSALIILGSAILFAVLLKPAGLVIAIAAAVAVSALASPTGLWMIVLPAAGYSIGSLLLFVYGLRQQLPVHGYWFGG